MTARVDDCCGDPSECPRVCDILGNSAEGARRTASTLAPSTLRAMERRAAPREMRLDYVPPRAAIEPRKVGLFERLIAGPQGDVTLKRRFLELLGCLACGTGLALLLVSIVLFFRAVLPE